MDQAARNHNRFVVRIAGGTGCQESPQVLSSGLHASGHWMGNGHAGICGGDCIRDTREGGSFGHRRREGAWATVAGRAGMGKGILSLGPYRTVCAARSKTMKREYLMVAPSPVPPALMHRALMCRLLQ